MTTEEKSYNKIKICIYVHILYISKIYQSIMQILKIHFLPEVEDKILTIATCVSESAS